MRYLRSYDRVQLAYYGSFVPGMRELIAKVFRERLPDASITKLLDGAIIFETECTYDRLNFFCFNNIFAVIDIEQSKDTSPELHMKKIASANIREKTRELISQNNKKIKTFRLVCSIENKPASVKESLRLEVEGLIARNSGLKPDRANPDTEFWFLYRREGFSVFMKRLTRSTTDEKSIRAGELAPPLAWLLCRLAELKSGETAADPFCGYGSIPEAALKHFHIEKFYASDADSRCVKTSGSKPALKSARCELRLSDVFSVPGFIPDHGVDAIVTDPPWGMYREAVMPLAKFYEETVLLFAKLLKSGGRCVILSAARNELESALEKTLEMHITQVLPILVSGKKAAVYVMVKTCETTDRVVEQVKTQL